MKSRILQMVALSALAMTVAGSAEAKTNVYINCQVEVKWSTTLLAVELSQTSWDLGTVALGGVKDSWFGQTTHGKFWVRNSGETNAAIYITAEGSYGSGPIDPDVKMPPDPPLFAMAVATNVTDLLPTWNVLNQTYNPSFPKRVGRYMRSLIPGDYMLFDLRFYAGTALGIGPGRTFGLAVYATSGESETP